MRYFVDVMTGVPSIVFGLFVYITLVHRRLRRRRLRRLEGLGRAGAADAAGRDALGRGRAAARARTACARPRWRSARRAGAWSRASCCRPRCPGLVTGSLLAVARAAGETAPLLFTSAIVLGTNFNLGERTNCMPIQIFNDVGQAQDRLVERAWGTALTLVAMILCPQPGRPADRPKEPPDVSTDMTTPDKTTPASSAARNAARRRRARRAGDRAAAKAIALRDVHAFYGETHAVRGVDRSTSRPIR